MTKLTGAFKSTQAVDQKTAYKQLARLVADPEAAAALQKTRTAGRASLTPRQTALVNHHDELVAANNGQAAAEKPRLPGTYKVEKTSRHGLGVSPNSRPTNKFTPRVSIEPS